jgi:threonine/homoserine/homoserine lactone efflux protein
MTGMINYGAFAAIAFMLVASPGPNLFLLLKNAPLLGVRVGLLNNVGISLAILCHASFSLIGISAIVLSSATAFSVLKFLGACYLICLGVLALRDAWKAKPIMASATAAPARRVTPWAALSEGWFTNILNPKPALFYVAIFPQFLDPASGGLLAQGLALGAIHATIAFFWYGFVVLAMDHVGAVLRRPAVSRTIKGVMGSLLVGFGIRLASLRAPAAP